MALAAGTLAAALVSACGGPRPTPAPEPSTTVTAEVTPSARGVPLTPDAWPIPAEGSSPTQLTDGATAGAPFVVADDVPRPYDFVFSVDARRPLRIAAIVVWGPEGAESRVDVYADDSTYPLVASTWWQYQESTPAVASGRVRLASGPTVLVLPEPVALRRFWISVLRDASVRSMFTEVSALGPEGLRVALEAGAAAVVLDPPDDTQQDAADPQPTEP